MNRSNATTRPRAKRHLHPRRRYEIEGRTVLITGAARGIGAQTAQALHGRGANVALVGLEAQRLEALAAQLGDRCACFEADVTDPAALERAVAGTVRIANAGIHIEGALATMDPEKVERVLEVNLLGVWRTDRAVLSHVIEIERAIARRSGRVWAPRYVLGAYLGRGLLAPLSERRAMGSPVLDESLELARQATPSPRRTQEPMAAVGEDGRL